MQQFTKLFERKNFENFSQPLFIHKNRYVYSDLDQSRFEAGTFLDIIPHSTLSWSFRNQIFFDILEESLVAETNEMHHLGLNSIRRPLWQKSFFFFKENAWICFCYFFRIFNQGKFGLLENLESLIERR